MKNYIGKTFEHYLKDGRNSLNDFKPFSNEELLNSIVEDFKSIEIENSSFLECLLLHLDGKVYSIIINYNNGVSIENKDAIACWSYDYSKRCFNTCMNKYLYDYNYKDAWESQDPSLLIMAYEESPNPDPEKDTKIRKMLQIFTNNNVKYEGEDINNNDIVNIARVLTEVPNPEIKIDKISKIKRICIPYFSDDYSLFDWFAGTGDEFYTITMGGKEYLTLMSDDGFNLFTPERANKFVDDMIEAGYIDDDYSEIPEIRNAFIDYAKGGFLNESLTADQKYPVKSPISESMVEDDEDVWAVESRDPKLLIKAYEEYPNPDSEKDTKIRKMLQIFTNNNVKYKGDTIENNDVVNIVRNLAAIPNPEIDINKITSIRRIGYPKFANNYDLFGWFANTGDEFYVISINGKKHLILISYDGVNIFTPERANKFVDDMIKTGYMEENDPDIPEIRDKFIEYSKKFSC